MNKLMKKDYKVVEHTKWYSLVSIAIILVAAVMMIVRAASGNNVMNFGIDFTGGATIEFELDSFAGEETFRTNFDKEMRAILGENYKVSDQLQVSPSTSGGYTYSYRLTYYFKGTYNDQTYNGPLGSSSEAHDAFIQSLKGDTFDKLVEKVTELVPDEAKSNFTTSNGSEYIRIFDVGPSASQTLLNSAILATVVALVVILIYIIIRFTFLSGFAAIIALLHDVAIMVALTAIFNIPVNSTFIAAVITIIGYSINASIVVFDKVRECTNPNNAAFAMASDAEIANYSIKHSFMKIFLSTLTTLIMVVAVALFAVSTIQEFVLPIIFGLISGLFSALCLSPTLWVAFRKIAAKRKSKKKTA